MKVPSDLIHKIQYEYVNAKYKDGVFTFTNLDDETIECVISAFLKWAEEKRLVKDNKLDITTIKEW